MAQPFYLDDDTKFEIGVDEVGRGPMFGRVYTAAVILPKEGFDYSLMKDSKKFTSEKKIKAAAEYIKENALFWAITYEDENVIDKINIRQATFKSMHKSIGSILEQINGKHKKEDIFLLIDGTDFKPYTKMIDDSLYVYNHECVKGGDDHFATISAASILAKVERDNYIIEMCKEYPDLNTFYNLEKNKGYGAKVHLEGIKKYGITKWHRKSFGSCKTANEIIIKKKE